MQTYIPKRREKEEEEEILMKAWLYEGYVPPGHTLGEGASLASWAIPQPSPGETIINGLFVHPVAPAAVGY